MTLGIPEGASLMFDGMETGDEDFFSEQSGHLNITFAYRLLRQADHRPRPCHIPRSDLPHYRKLRDINDARVQWLKQAGPAALYRPLLTAELMPGQWTLVDGIHRLMALSEVLTADPIPFHAYLFPHEGLNLIRINVYLQYDDGRQEPVDNKQYMEAMWGKYTTPTGAQRS